MPDMHAPSDPQLCSPQVSAMSLENHQFCNIKVRGSRTPCPNLPVGRACRSFSSQALQVPLTDFQVSAERNQTLPSQVHTELLAGPYSHHSGLLGLSQTCAQGTGVEAT